MSMKTSTFLYGEQKMIRSLLITPDFPPDVGGIQNYLYNICRNLQADTISVIAPYTHGYENFDTKQSFPIYRAGSIDYNMERKFGLVPLLLPLLRLSWRIARIHDIDIIQCGHVTMGLVCLILKYTLRKPYIIYTYAAELTSGRFRILKTLALKKANKVVTISEYTRKCLLELGVQQNRITKITPGINVNDFQFQINYDAILTKYNLYNKKIILTVSRLGKFDQFKGHDKVLKALPSVIKEFPNAVYLIVGTGNDEDRLKRIVVDSHLEQYVIFTGRVSSDELIMIYHASELFIMPSRITPDGIAEGFGIVYLEANACGKPVIGGKVGGGTDAVIDGETGLLVNPENIEEIADTIIRLLSDEQFAKKLGQQGRQRVLEQFTWQNVSAKVAQLLHELNTKQ